MSAVQKLNEKLAPKCLKKDKRRDFAKAEKEENRLAQCFGPFWLQCPPGISKAQKQAEDSEVMLMATLHALGFVVWSVKATIEKALERLGLGWRNNDE